MRTVMANAISSSGFCMSLIFRPLLEKRASPIWECYIPNSIQKFALIFRQHRSCMPLEIFITKITTPSSNDRPKRRRTTQAQSQNEVASESTAQYIFNFRKSSNYGSHRRDRNAMYCKSLVFDPNRG